MSAMSANHRNPIATASGVIAIAALTLTFAPFVLLKNSGYSAVLLVLLGAPLGVLAIVLGAIGLFRSSKLDGKGAPAAVIGVVGGIVAPLGSLAWLFSPGCSLTGC